MLAAGIALASNQQRRRAQPSINTYTLQQFPPSRRIHLRNSPNLPVSQLTDKLLRLIRPSKSKQKTRQIGFDRATYRNAQLNATQLNLADNLTTSLLRQNRLEKREIRHEKSKDSARWIDLSLCHPDCDLPVRSKARNGNKHDVKGALPHRLCRTSFFLQFLCNFFSLPFLPLSYVHSYVQTTPFLYVPQYRVPLSKRICKPYPVSSWIFSRARRPLRMYGMYTEEELLQFDW